jgi:hypothetical protein
MITLAVLSSLAFAVDLEVKPGDDINTLTASLGPGDQVVFSGGTYTIEAELYWSFEGTAADPVVLKAAKNAEVIIELIPGDDDDYPGQIARFDKAAYVRVEGLRFTGSGPSGKREDGDGHHGILLSESHDIELIDVEVDNVTFTLLYLQYDNSQITLDRVHLHNNEDGRAIWAGCSDGSCWLSDSLITNSWFHNIRGNDGGVYLSDGSQGVTIEHTIFHDIDAQGIRIGDTFGGAPNVLYGNAIWDVMNQGIEARGAARIRNNILFDIEGDGIHTSDLGGVLEDQVISFNTILDTSEYAVEIREWWNKENMVFANNALCNTTGLGLFYGQHEVDTGLLRTTNLISQNVVCGYVDSVGLPDGGIVGGGGFYDYIDVEGWDLYPTVGSALVDAADPGGETWIPDEDFNGAPREGKAPDVGAYEWSGEENPGWQVREGFKELGYEREVQAEQVGGCCNDSGNAGQALLFLPLIGLGVGFRRRR